jgi:probable biosynthetic protein (TIGR04098 family)
MLGGVAMLEDVIARVLPMIVPADMSRPLEELAIDSFSLLTLRTELEEAAGRPIPDADWTRVGSLSDVLALARGAPLPSPASESRQYSIGMPQMAIGGLSESWLFKELGDLHWSMIAEGLGVPSSRVADGDGNRLYATFTRIRLSLDSSLRAFRENERLSLEGRLSRFGAGMFFSDIAVEGDGKAGRASLMSAFSKRGEAGSNVSLLKGQPKIPANCAVPAVDGLPPFGLEYRDTRAMKQTDRLHETEYRIQACHDINGVGLLYFAAYPAIADICETSFTGWDAPYRYSTRTRDVFYFANCEPSDTIVYQLHAVNDGDGRRETVASLSRKSDGTPMALIKKTAVPA